MQAHTVSRLISTKKANANVPEVMNEFRYERLDPWLPLAEPLCIRAGVGGYDAATDCALAGRSQKVGGKRH
jgi:hypothetical protein